MNGFTQGGESQPFPLVHRAIGDYRSDGQREDRLETTVTRRKW